MTAGGTAQALKRRGRPRSPTFRIDETWRAYHRMKHFRFALIVFALALGIVRVCAQDEEERKAPPIEIPDFSNLDEYIYVPQSTVTLGFRHLSGPKMKFSGT